MAIGMKSVLAVVAALTLAGCAAAGYPPTFGDPQAKLQYAWQLMQSDRPLPAQHLILEAIDSYTQSGNEVALAEAYCVYADFLTWGSESQGQHYATKGFLPINGASIARVLQVLDGDSGESQEESVIDSLLRRHGGHLQ
jgi:hypothetical protein